VRSWYNFGQRKEALGACHKLLYRDQPSECEPLLYLCCTFVVPLLYQQWQVVFGAGMWLQWHSTFRQCIMFLVWGWHQTTPYSDERHVFFTKAPFTLGMDHTPRHARLSTPWMQAHAYLHIAQRGLLFPAVHHIWVQQ
jgi:hypothetical protein